LKETGCSSGGGFGLETFFPAYVGRSRFARLSPFHHVLQKGSVMEDKDFKRDSEKDSSLQVDVLAYIIKQQESKNADLVEILAEMLNASIPDRVTISRSGFFGRGKVTKLEIRFDKVTYDIEKSFRGLILRRFASSTSPVALTSPTFLFENCSTRLYSVAAPKNNHSRACPTYLACHYW